MKNIRIDGDGEFNIKNFQEYLAQKGVRHEIIAPYSPEQNGFCEQDNRTIMESAQFLDHPSGYPLSFFG